jgi:hypothetical protein
MNGRELRFMQNARQNSSHTKGRVKPVRTQTKMEKEAVQSELEKREAKIEEEEIEDEEYGEESESDMDIESLRPPPHEMSSKHNPDTNMIAVQSMKSKSKSSIGISDCLFKALVLLLLFIIAIAQFL